MKWNVKSPDGKLIPVEAASKQEAISLAQKSYAPPQPTQAQKMKSFVSGKLGHASDKALQKFPFMKGGDTWPEIIGQMAGQGVGGYIGAQTGLGALPAVAGGAIGNMTGTVAPQILKQTGDLFALRKPTTANFDKDRLKRSAQRGAAFSALGESVPTAWRGVKAAGKEILSGVSSMSGVTDRVDQLRRLPFWEQLKVLKPWHSASIPKPEVAGQAQGAIEKRLGIPSLEEGVDLDKAYGVPKGKTAVGKTQIKGIPGDLEKMHPAARAAIEKQLGSGPKEPPASVALRVHRMMEKGLKPTISDAVVAIRHTGERLAYTEKEVPKMVLSKQYQRLNKYIASQIEELAKARNLTHLANLRQELLHALPRSPSGDPYRFGVMRLFWRASMLLASLGMMSPWGSGAAAMTGDVVTKLLDPILSNKATGALASGGFMAMQKRKSEKK